MIYVLDKGGSCTVEGRTVQNALNTPAPKTFAKISESGLDVGM